MWFFKNFFLLQNAVILVVCVCMCRTFPRLGRLGLLSEVGRGCGLSVKMTANDSTRFALTSHTRQLRPFLWVALQLSTSMCMCDYSTSSPPILYTHITHQHHHVQGLRWRTEKGEGPVGGYNCKYIEHLELRSSLCWI